MTAPDPSARPTGSDPRPAPPPPPPPGSAPAAQRPAGGAQPSGDDRGASKPAQEKHRGRAIGRTLAAALLVFVTVILVLFVVFNTQSVDISLVFVDVEAPLVLALVIAAVLGGLIVGLASAATRARRKNRS